MSVTITSESLTSGVDAMAERLMDRLAVGFQQEVQGNASRRTGALAESVTVHPTVMDESGVSCSVTVDAQSEAGDFYGQYQDEGTGIYGPEGVPIRPKKPGGVLVFDWPAAGGVVFAHQVQGSEPTRFWTKALDAWDRIVATASHGG